MKCKVRTYTGTPSSAQSRQEQQGRAVAHKAAVESIVLLKNSGILPVSSERPVVLLGSGSLHTIKGGTGSGDVNEREVVSVYAGLKSAGYSILNEAWLEAYESTYQTARAAWKRSVLEKADTFSQKSWALFQSYVTTPFIAPVEPPLSCAALTAMKHATAVYVLSRNAGEGVDRRAKAGDYYLTPAEKAQLEAASHHFTGLVLVLNCGSVVDLSFTQEIKVDAILHLSQPGMEGGKAFADIFSGKATPCGKMTDTWACSYEDYPNSATFSYNSGNVDTELYSEGIYVGYRYFDTFGITPCIPFGFGLSYTQFSLETTAFSIKKENESQPEVTMQVLITNIGTHYAGKQVVQVYAHCPQGKLKKEKQRLCAFGKTPLLKPGECCTLKISFPVTQLLSFSEAESAYLLEAGEYLIAVGDSSVDNAIIGKVVLDKTVAVISVQPICPLQQPLPEIEPATALQAVYCEVPPCKLAASDIISTNVCYDLAASQCKSKIANGLANTLSQEQLIALTNGEPGKGQDASSTFGSAGVSVPGAAGETSDCAAEQPWNLPGIVLADGPAGLRLARNYLVHKNGDILRPNFIDMVEQGLFALQQDKTDCAEYYQYCTAFPVGTMLAQSWDPALLYEVGQAVAVEMEAFGITLWLAPGMNIHRNPLCGRNFEYYSEDPLLTGTMASALTNGVQSGKGIGTTIKHFACNNQEDNRKGCNSVVSERTLREIYLRGFEIAVKQSQPMSIMTSYNLLNGVHTANSYDLITKVARNEWGFAGVMITDWVTTGEGGSSAVACMKAGNDLIMPGCLEDMDAIRTALSDSDDGALSLQEVKSCVTRLINIILQSNRYEDCASYTQQFSQLTPCFTCTVMPTPQAKSQ